MIKLHLSLVGHRRIDFDRRQVRKGLRQAARPVVQDARRLVGRRSVSAPGEFPGRGSGALQRAIRAKASRSGFAVTIAPYRTPALMRKGAQVYYPAFLVRGAERTRGGRLAPRENFIVAAAERHGPAVRQQLAAVLRASLVPRR